MATPKLTVTTPHGTFKRQSAKPYAFVGISVYTSRNAGDITTAHWSRTQDGTAKLAAQYGRKVLGVYPVDPVDPADDGSGFDHQAEERDLGEY